MLKIKFLIIWLVFIKSVGVWYFKVQFIYLYVYFNLTDLVLIVSVNRKVINNMKYYVIVLKIVLSTLLRMIFPLIGIYANRNLRK